MKQRFLLVVAIIFSSFTLFAQPNSVKTASSNFDFYTYKHPIHKDKYRITILTPMYLDSFDLKKNIAHIPKYAQAGIDFYEGAMIAADTLNKMGYKINMYVYDSKSQYMNLQSLIISDKLDSTDVIIGNVGGDDLKLIADFAKAHHINFVSAVSPADADQSNNPFFTILQPRLISHIQRIHKQINNKQPSAKVLFIHRNSTSEKNAYQYYVNDQSNKSINPITELELTTNEIDEKYLLAKLDSNAENVICLAILDPAIAYKNLKILNAFSLKGYRLKVYGMPTWDNIKELKSAEDLPETNIYVTTPMMVDNYTASNRYINDKYKNRMGSAPSDIVYKGFESVYYFANLLNQYGTPFNNYLSNNSYSFITPYKIVPTKEEDKFLFFENKFLYIIRYQNGTMTYE